MLFTSTRDNTLSVKFSQAVRDCISTDGGVFVPAANAFEDLRRWIYYINKDTSFTSIAGTLSSAFLNEEFSPIICQTIAEKAFPFSPVIKQLDDNLFNLELFHGYTGCYRDFGVSYLCSYLETTHTLNGGNSLFVDFTHGELGALLAKVLKDKKHIKAVLVYQKGSVRGLAQEDLIWNRSACALGCYRYETRAVRQTHYCRCQLVHSVCAGTYPSARNRTDCP